MALGYGLDYRRSLVRFSAGLGVFLFTTASRPALGPTQLLIQCAPGVLSLGVTRLGREANNSTASSAEVKDAWRYTSTPPVRLNGMVIRRESTGTTLPLPSTLLVLGLNTLQNLKMTM
jgi:hypothetical protein